jgi:hypothetical protein
MLLVRAQARKWQSGWVLHKRTLTEVFRASGFGLDNPNSHPVALSKLSVRDNE